MNLMGYWGYGPFDSDGAADLVAGLMRPVERVLKGGRDAEAYYGEARAAIDLMLCAAGTDILGGPDLRLARDAIDRILADKAWIETFPAKMKASILRQRRRVADAVARAARRRSRTVQKLVSATRARASATKGTRAKPWRIAKGRFPPAKP